ncbi:hypothetical protein QBC39DRAFT_112562 [Podospora conica]|nr:hypothetical protein QBC39DRAFT_112562 [Schizothecium conicum]
MLPSVSWWGSRRGWLFRPSPAYSPRSDTPCSDDCPRCLARLGSVGGRKTTAVAMSYWSPVARIYPKSALARAHEKKHTSTAKPAIETAQSTDHSQQSMIESDDDTVGTIQIPPYPTKPPNAGGTAHQTHHNRIPLGPLLHESPPRCRRSFPEAATIEPLRRHPSAEQTRRCFSSWSTAWRQDPTLYKTTLGLPRSKPIGLKDARPHHGDNVQHRAKKQERSHVHHDESRNRVKRKEAAASRSVQTVS